MSAGVFYMCAHIDIYIERVEMRIDGCGEGSIWTYPPLKAPTGFRAGRAAVAVASWSRRAEEWKVREVLVWSGIEGVVDVWRKARIEGVRSLEAMVEERRDGRVDSWLQSRLLGKGEVENGCGERSVGMSVGVWFRLDVIMGKCLVLFLRKIRSVERNAVAIRGFWR